MVGKFKNHLEKHSPLKQNGLGMNLLLGWSFINGAMDSLHNKLKVELGKKNEIFCYS